MNDDRSTPTTSTSVLNPVALSVLVIALFVALFELILQSESRKIETESQLNAVSYGSVLRAKADRELNSLLFISSGIASYLTVYHQNLESEKVQAVLANLYSGGKLIRNFGVAVGYRLSYVYPMKGNEKAIGLYYPDQPKQWPQVKQAIDSRHGVLAGPVDLVQGGRGLIYRQPIYIDGQY